MTAALIAAERAVQEAQERVDRARAVIAELREVKR